MSDGRIGYWRSKFRPVIHAALEATKGKTEKEIRKAIRDAYPLFERKYWPYKVWCDEVRCQRGLRLFGGQSQTMKNAIAKAGQGSLEFP